MNRDERAHIAAETVAIVAAGNYQTPGGQTVSIAADVAATVRRTELFTPDQAAELRGRARAASPDSRATAFDVRNEATLAAARRLVGRYGSEGVAALNFASAKNPGGGFLGGSQAQEESLARASALYACLQSQPAYYEANRRERSLLYTDHLIVSPGVPVFRDDDGRLLGEPWRVTIITAPAPNAGAVAENEPRSLPLVEPALRCRAELVLATAAASGHTAVVLGAWGCGVFRNDPHVVARAFADLLLPGHVFAGAFEHVTFAVLDRQGHSFAAFAEVFSTPPPHAGSAA